MVPAMDRGISTHARRHWIVLGFVLVLSASTFGCSELKSQIFGDSKIGDIGQVQETNDIYARNAQPRVLMPPANNMIASDGANVVPGTNMTDVKEAGPAVLPAEIKNGSPAIATGVALQNPRPVDLGSNVKLTSNTAGVPDAARILAGSERKPAVKPETIVAEARAAIETMTAYEVSLHRQERVNGSLLPEEDVVVSIRRSPRAVRLSWPAGPNQGREVLYRSDEPGGQMHIKMANPAMPRLSLNPESPMVMKNSRHPVTEAGFDSLIEGLENGVEASAISYAGIETPAGVSQPSHCLTRLTPSGETWKVYLDVDNHLPSLVQATDARGDLIERYVFHDLKANPAELASAEAFDPIGRWGQPRGLLSRLTRGSSESDAPQSDSTPH